MSKEAQAASAAETTTTTTAAGSETSLLDQITSQVPVASTDKAEDVFKRIMAMLPELESTPKSVARGLKKLIELVDNRMSRQLAELMHKPEFLKLEGTWRGLHYLVQNSETCETLKIQVLNASRNEIYKDLDSAIEFDQSFLFKKVYTGEFGQAGGKPFGALIGDYEFKNHPEDIDFLSKMSQVAAAAFCPFISAASPEMFGYKSWTQLNDTRDLSGIFENKSYVKWREFRDTEDSRYVVLTFPRVMARLPYGSNNRKIDEFKYEEVPLDSKGRDTELPHDQYCWMNCAWALAAKLTDAFAKTNWCTAIRGYANGGIVENLPAHIYTSSKDGGSKIKCPTEVLIPDRRDAEISKLGFLALCNYKDTSYSVFFGAQTTQKAKKYDKVSATENAVISAKLPYILASSRMAHYLKMIARDKLGDFLELEDCQAWLDNWVGQYILGDAKGSAEMKKKFPLAEAKIDVRKIPGRPGSYAADVRLRPWLQFEELNAAVGMVAEIPRK
jgi:type VI secretion system protein ImpC